MVSKKYLSDYEIKHSETKSGKLKARAVYKGRLYAYAEPEKEIRRTAKYFTALTALSWLAFALPLFIQSSAARTVYVMIPHACVFLPLISMSSVTADLWLKKPPFTRETSEHISQRAPKSALFMVLFSGVAAAGFLIRLISGQKLMLPGDLIFGLCEAAVLTASCLLFGARARAATKEIQ